MQLTMMSHSVPILFVERSQRFVPHLIHPCGAAAVDYLCQQEIPEVLLVLTHLLLRYWWV